MRAREIDGRLDAAALAAAWRGRGLAWLDGDGASEQGRWSFVGCDPVEVREVRWGDPAPFEVLRGLETGASGGPSELDPGQVPAWIGLFTYDACWSAARALGLRRAPRLPRDRDAVIARFARYDALFARDAVSGRAWIVGDDERAIERLEARLGERREAPRARIDEPLAEPAAVHHAAIERALEHIAAGEIYQVNLARRWVASLEGDPIALFLAMRAASPVPFGAYLELGAQGCVLARTMERFLRWDARTRALETRPIKGTIARRGDDRGEAAALRADAKERAEHAMIVDLMRNDLGRVAEIGSVRASDVMAVEPYAGLSHLVSTVRATTRPEIGPAEILEATFPPGSISGTPKLRALELIEALERFPRGAYCGAIGHVDRAGGLSLAVAIRTAAVRGQEVAYFAGGGLVEASVPEREVAETDLKARVLLEAVRDLASEQEGAGAHATTTLCSGVV